MTTTRSTTTEIETADPTMSAGSGGLNPALPMSPAEIRDAVDSVARYVPDVARSSRSLMEDAMQGIERSSDERVAAGVTLSLGLAVGMLIGGAPRLLTVLALIPVAAFGLVMMDRRGTGTASRTSRTAA
jgi:hypothetical protein